MLLFSLPCISSLIDSLSSSNKTGSHYCQKNSCKSYQKPFVINKLLTNQDQYIMPLLINKSALGIKKECPLSQPINIWQFCQYVTGNFTTDHGLQWDPDEASATLVMTLCRGKADVQRFVGMAKYLSTYLPNLSMIIRPLTELARSDTPFSWAQTQDGLFKKAKQFRLDSPIAYQTNFSVKPCQLRWLRLSTFSAQ